MALVELFPGEYCWVALSGFTSGWVVFWLGSKVIEAREKFGVKLPNMYDTSGTEKGELFNCYQRGHQNALESYPYFLFLLTVGGIKHPVIAGSAGFLWSFGRIMYARGYWTGKPENRSKGAPFIYPALTALMGCTLSFSYTLFKKAYLEKK